VLDVIREQAGPENVDITLGYVGVQPSSYPINTIFLWTGGAHEGVLQVALRQNTLFGSRPSRKSCAAPFTKDFPTRSSPSSPATSSAGS
jgi:hypothetical protein